MENLSTAPRLPRKRRSLAQELVTVLSEPDPRRPAHRGIICPPSRRSWKPMGSPYGVREAISPCGGRALETRHGSAPCAGYPSPSGFRIDPATVVTLRDVLAILELRISLEVESAGLAAQRRSDEQLAAMRAALDALNESAAHASDAVASDFQFHLQIALSTGNRYFTDIMTHPGHQHYPAHPPELSAPGP